MSNRALDGLQVESCMMRQVRPEMTRRGRGTGKEADGMEGLKNKYPNLQQSVSVFRRAAVGERNQGKTGPCRKKMCDS